MNIWINWFISLFLYRNNKLTDLPFLIKSYDDLDDDPWIANKKKFWKNNNISPLKIKDGTISPKKLLKLLEETFSEHY
jgi:hypothetical protein